MSKKEQILIAAPDIGSGNLVECIAARENLRQQGHDQYEPKISILKSGLIKIGSRWHQTMSTDTLKSLNYCNGNTRNGLLGWTITQDMTILALKELKNIGNCAGFVTPQDMMAKGVFLNMGDSIPIVQLYPDVQGKFNSEAQHNKGLLHFVWNREAYQLISETVGEEIVYLIEPLNPFDAFRKEKVEKEGLPTGKLCIIKLSGSGGDEKLINQLIQSLQHRLEPITFTGTDKTAKKIISNGPVFSDNDPLLYHLVQDLRNGDVFITNPSEQIKVIANFTNNGQHPYILLLPPRGIHEVNNIKWAIEKGLASTICVPEVHKDQLSIILQNAGINQNAFTLVDPGEVTIDRMHQPNRWEIPNDAITISAALKSALSTFKNR